MRQLGGRPLILEKRPRRLRPCLGCGRPMLTTLAERLCKACRQAAARGGVDEVSLLGALTRGRRV